MPKYLMPSSPGCSTRYSKEWPASICATASSKRASATRLRMWSSRTDCPVTAAAEQRKKRSAVRFSQVSR